MDRTAADPKTLMETLDIELIDATQECVRMRMPVGPKVHQPYGMLHGGASVALAESAASIGASLHCDAETQVAFGMEINANHLRPMREGFVLAVARPLHKGKTSMVWGIEIRDEQERLVCVSRCTVALVARRA